MSGVEELRVALLYYRSQLHVHYVFELNAMVDGTHSYVNLMFELNSFIHLLCA